MLTEQHLQVSLIEREKRKPSVFRPPKFFKASPTKSLLAASARPWAPDGRPPASIDDSQRASRRPIQAPVALGLSPEQMPRRSPPPLPQLSHMMAAAPSSPTLFSPLSTPVNAFFHTFTDEATERRVYPVDMFMSVRRDASHTPHGVLKWCVRQYVEVPSLKVPRHLQLSMSEAINPEDGVTRGALGAGLKTRHRLKPVRQTHHKVLSVLSRITRAKYNELLEELLQLPLRQADDAELRDVVKVFFDKSVQEHEYSDIYAQLVKELCTAKEGERELDAALQERLLSNRMRHQLIAASEEQFKRPIELTEDEKVDRTTGKPFDEEEIDMKRTRMKNRLVGNLKFVGELYKLDLVTENIIETILTMLVGGYDRARPEEKEEYIFEVFATLIKTVAATMNTQCPHVLARFMRTAKAVEESHPRPRVRFLMMDLSDLAKKNSWAGGHDGLSMRSTAVSSPAGSPTASSIGNRGSASPMAIPVNRSASLLNNDMYDSGNANTSGRFPSFKAGPHGPQMPQPPQHINGGFGSQSPTNMSASASINECNVAVPRSRTAAASLHASHSTNSILGSSGPIPAGSASPTNSVPAPAKPISIPYAVPRSASTPQVVVTAPPGQAGQAGGKGHAVLSKDGNSHAGAVDHALPHGGSRASLSYSLAEKASPFTPAISASDLSSAQTSDGARTPMMSRHQRAPLLPRKPASGSVGGGDVVNLQEVAHQLLEKYNDPAQSASVVRCIGEMALKNKVVCLTWWLRIVSTHTAMFAERQRVTNLLCDILSSCPSMKAEELFAAIVEWLRFDIEQGLYDQCPRMFDNIAHMVLYCHSPDVSHLENISTVRQLLHSGLFNVMLHGLTVDGGTDQMVTLVKSALPVSMSIMGNVSDPSTDAAMLRVAVENRFRLLPYFLSVSSTAESGLPGTPASSCRTPTTPSMRNPLGDSITGTVHYDPLSRCLSLQRVADDPELQLFRKIQGEQQERGGGAAGTRSWQEDAVKLALAPVGNDSRVSQLLQLMKVTGTLLSCTSVTQHSANLITFADVDEVLKTVLAQREGAVFQAAAIIELVMHFTQSLSVNGGTIPRKSTRIKPLRQAFARWCSHGLVSKATAMALVHAVEKTAPSPRVFTTYHNAITDNELHWSSTLTCLS